MKERAHRCCHKHARGTGILSSASPQREDLTSPDQRKRVTSHWPLAAMLLGMALARPEFARGDPPRENLPSGHAAAPVGTLALSDHVDLARLVDLCAQRLGVSIDYDPKVLTGSATLRALAGVSDAETWSLTNQLLAGRGFTTVQPSSGQGLSVVRIEQAAGLARVEDLTAPRAAEDDAERAKPFASPAPPGYRTVMVRVVHRPAKDILDGIKAVLSKAGSAASEVPGSGSGGGVGTPTTATATGPTLPTSAGSGAGAIAGGAGTGHTPVGAGGLMLISDLSPRIDLALDLLARLDTAVESGVVEEIALTNLSPAQAISLARALADRREAMAGRKAVGDLMPSPAGSSVLVIAPADRVAYWRAIVATIDQREGVETANYTPRHFGLRDVAKLIEETLGVRAGQSTSLVAPTGGPGSGASGSGSGAISVVDDRFRMIVDDLTGTLIITATPTQHEKIGTLMKRLDSVPAAARRPVRSYTLRNRPVKEVVAVLGEMLGAGVLEAGAAGDASAPTGGEAPGSGTGAAPPGAVAPGEPYRPGVTPTLPARVTGGDASRESGTGAGSTGLLGTSGRDRASTSSSGSRRNDPGSPSPDKAAGALPPLSLTSDEATNTLVAVGEPRLLAQLETLLATLDVRQPQVMLEVLLLSLTDSQTLALGIELERLTGAGDAQLRLSSLFGLSTTNAGSTTPGTSGSGGTVTVLSPLEFSIVIRALETLNQGRSLSVPRLLVGNNQKGDFTSNLQQPVQTSTTQNQTTTQGFAGYEQAGTTVSVQPRITEADHLLLQYSVTLSSFVGQGAGTLPPPRQENRLASQVSIPDGHSVALGGIELTTTGEQTSQVPLLGSIPLIGEVFKSRSNSGNRSRFFVFIRAEVMRSATLDDLKYISDVTGADAGVSDGFPVLKPQVMR